MPQDNNQQLTEAQQYYIGLFARWQKMSKDEKVKIDNPELWEGLQKVEFDKEIEHLVNEHLEFVYYPDGTKIKSLKLGEDKLKTKINLYFEVEYDTDYDIDENGKYINIENYISNSYLKEPRWFSKVLELFNLDYYLDNLKLLNINFNGIVNFPADIKLLIEFQKQNRLEIVNCINYEILENQQLKQELELRNNQIKVKSNVFIFEKEIPQEYRTAFGEYFMGIKDFIYLAKGKNLGISIDINGYLKITIHSELQEDIDLVEKAFIDFTRNIEPILKNQTPTLITPVDDLLRANKAIIILTNKIKTLETSIMTANLLSSNTLLDENETIKRLTQINNKLENKLLRLQSDYGTLQDQNIKLLTQLSEVKNLLLSSKTNGIYSDTSDAIVGLLSQIKIAIDSQESSLLKRSINFLDDFVKLNETKIKLIPIPKILDILKSIIQDFHRK